MKMRFIVFALLMLFWGGSALAGKGGEVVVSFPNSEYYTDIEPQGWESRETLRQLERHMQSLGNRYLLPGHILRVEVLDIDRAGSIDWTQRRLNPIRVLRGITWPSIKLHYVLEKDGSILADSEDTIADIDYLVHGNRYFSGDPLRYEKQLLHDWFRNRFGKHQGE